MGCGEEDEAEAFMCFGDVCLEGRDFRDEDDGEEGYRKLGEEARVTDKVKLCHGRFVS